MNNEIKEILDYVFSLAIGESYTCEYEDIQKARDYITNLQTIEQQYSAILSENAELENKLTNLQEENKKLQDRNIELVLERDRLKELCDKYELGKYDYSVPIFELKEVIKSE